jgi:Fe-S oxidoreductase
MVEFTADSPDELARGVRALTDHLEAVQGEPGQNQGFRVTCEAGQIARLWDMRKRAVGLLGNTEGDKRPIPFVEDTAVPPENLADFIMEFRAVLDRHGLDYGMFGHVDAGVLHVRPAINMKDADQERHIRAITDEVVSLTRKYKGLLWGEHGKGMRSEYAPELFGPLYPCLQRIKAAFDPRNQLNPGKICTPAGSGAELLKIDGVVTRGRLDRTIPAPVRGEYGAAMHCNGNAACFNFDPNDAMCPSWKGTRERIHSPKGRASLFREWLRLMAERGVDPVAETKRTRAAAYLRTLPARLRNTLSKRRGEYDFSHEVHVAMSGCLACKSCVSQCPVKVDVPDFRSRFLELYYGRYLRPVKDYLVCGIEHVLPWTAMFPGVYNRIVGSRLVAELMRRHVGLVDLPQLSGIDLAAELKRRGVAWAAPAVLEALPAADRERAVIVVQDAFTSYYETRLVLDFVDLLSRLGFTPLVVPFSPNGKPLHVHGFLKAFERVAARNAAMLRDLASHGVPLIGVDPSMTLTYRSEYLKALGPDAAPQVHLIQEWLAGKTDQFKVPEPRLAGPEYGLLAHCTESTMAVSGLRDWQTVFDALGCSLKPVAVGCCGMAGTYGHEAANADTSRRIYDLSWSAAVGDDAQRDRLMATGYSCRSQVRRIDGQRLRHPVRVLLDTLTATGN